MGKTIRIGIIVLIVLGIGAYVATSKIAAPLQHTQEAPAALFDGRNSTFTLEGASISLVNGISELPVPNSEAKMTTRYFGNEARGDLNADGKDDTVFLVSVEGGGSGLFYYAVAAVSTPDGYKTTNAFLIGDRIAPQSTFIPQNSGEVQINYAARKPDEPMTATPSQGKTLLLKVTQDGTLEGLMQ